jgi:hypothetical protein
VSQDYECRYWAEKFGVSPDELKAAAAAAGPMADDIARHLGKAVIAFAAASAPPRAGAVLLSLAHSPAAARASVPTGTAPACS